MLKSLSTQFIATLCFGPIGLVYSSMAAAVFLTLILAVLYFTEIGIAAVVIIWPIAIVAGLIFVKLHNDQIRSSGSTLLLGPDDEDQGLSAIGSWMRGIAVLALLGVGSYVVFSTNKEDFTDSVADRVADATAPGEDVKQVKQIEVLGSVTTDNDTNNVNDNDNDNDNELNLAETFPLGDDGVVLTSSTVQPDSSVTVITLDEQTVQPVVIGTAAQSSSPDRNIWYVDSELVNLRDGPGTNFSILIQVVRGDELAEIERAGNWIRVEMSDTGATGWIYSRLVSPQR